MAELPSRVKGYCPLEMDEYKRNAEFNPRAAAPPSSAPAADHTPWPLNNCTRPPFSAEPVPDSATLHAAAKWWVSPSRASPTAVFGAAAAARLPNHNVDAVDHSRLSVHDNGAPALLKDALNHFAANDLSRNNPYLDAALRSPSASWCQMQQQQVNTGTADDWSGNGTFAVRNATYPQPVLRPGFDQDVFHPVFAEHSAYPVLQPARAAYNFQQFAAAHRPMCPSYANMLNGDGSVKVGDDPYGWSSTDQVRNVAKSQSMRALYEENAALRRALLSMRRGSLFAVQGEQIIPGEQDRYIASDVTEGRALSMRERGRWAMQAAGEVVGGDGSCPMWAGTPRRPWAAGPPLNGIQAPAATHRRHHAHHHGNGWEDVPAEHPLYYGGGSFGGWPEDSMCGSTKEYPHWGEMQQNDCQSGVNGDEARRAEGTSLKQLLVESDRARTNGNKWPPRQGKKKALHSCEEVVGKQATDEPEGQCAMCGGKLRNVEAVGGKKAGLPLRLCPACHPRAAASLPHSTTAKSPPLSSQTRHHVATAIFMACRPNTTNAHLQDPKYAAKKIKPKNRIVDLCRHFVGLAAKPPPPTA